MVLNKKQLASIAVIEKSLKELKLGSKSEKPTKLTKKVEDSIIECTTKKELGEFDLAHLEAFAKKHKIKSTKALLTTAVLKYIKENYESDSDTDTDTDTDSD